MKYEVLNLNGECHETFVCRDIALEALLEMIARDPSAAEEFEILETDDDGEVLGRLDIDNELLPS